MASEIKTTIVTAGDAAFAWGALILVASMRRNGMEHPVLIGAMGWSDEMKRRVESLGGVEFVDLPKDRRCVTCQKPILMTSDKVTTPWVCWADSDAAFVGDCSEWLAGETEDEIVTRKYIDVPDDFTPKTLETWRRDVERFTGSALDKCRYDSRFNASFIVVHRKWKGFLEAWARQIENVLPADVEIIMKHGSPYYQTDESVLASLLCYMPSAPKVCKNFKANATADKNRYFAHFAWNPKPWQMWNSHSLRWHDVVAPVVDWLVEKGVVERRELPLALRKNLWPLWKMLAPLAPWVWRAIKLKRRIARKIKG